MSSNSLNVEIPSITTPFWLRRVVTGPPPATVAPVDRHIIPAEVGDIAQISHRPGPGHPRHAHVHH